MKSRLKFIPVLLAGYAVAVTVVVIMMTRGHVEGFEAVTGVAWLLFYVCAVLLPVSWLAWTLHLVIVALALLNMFLRKRAALLHLPVAVAAGFVVGIGICFFLATSANKIISVPFILPFACASLAMGCVARMSFTGTSVPPRLETVRAPTPRWHGIAWGVGWISVAALALAFAYPRYKAREQWHREWARTRELVSPLVTNGRFPNVHVDRARDGSVFLYGGVQTVDDLQALNQVVNQAGLPRRPQIVVTVADQRITQRSLISTNAARR